MAPGLLARAPRAPRGLVHTFSETFDHAMDVLKTRLADGEPTAATLTHVVDGTTENFLVMFNEQVGFVDDRRRAVFTFDADDVLVAVDRGDFFVLDGDTERWYAVDIRDDKAGGIEIRCDATLERL